MIGIYQDIHHAEKGNCFAACIASVLEIPLNKIGDDCELPWDERWRFIQSSMRKFGWDFLFMRIDEPDNFEFPGICIGAVASSTHAHVLHAVVISNNQVIWDPNQSNDLSKYKNFTWKDATDICILFPLNPRIIEPTMPVRLGEF